MGIVSNSRTVISGGNVVVNSYDEVNLPGSPATGTVAFNNNSQSMEIFDGTDWVPVSFTADGSTIAKAAPSGEYLYNLGIRQNGTYWIKPLNYSGDPFEVYVDFDGTVSGITGGGGWMRIAYSQDYYSQASPWEAVGNQMNSVVFGLEHTDAQVNALLDAASESRCKFESWGKGSVGWTYGTGDARINNYMAVSQWMDGTGETVNHTSANYWPSTLTYSFTNINTFNNSGTDPSDANDAVWRQGIIYIRDTTATKLPIRRILHDDVDTAGEARYFPLQSTASHTWCK